ncbi:MAG: TlpA family protein disulfide reductase [Candidatus Limnocylindrales bacterium]
MALVVIVALAARPSGPTVIGGHPLLDAPAPDFALLDLDGRVVRLADYRGRPVIVNFWASWCIPCRDEFPLLAAARDRYADAGLEVLGVVYDDDPDAARDYMARAGAHWPALVDPASAVASAYTVNAPPLSFFVDGQGIVRSIAYGPPPSGSIEERIAAILPPPTPAASP